MTNNFFYLANMDGQIPEIPADSIISRTFYQDENTKAILFGFAEGQELSEHTASRPAILHFLKGRAAITLGEEEYEAEAGAWSHLPPNLPHSVKASTEVVMLLLLL
jgi:quercetin dioxygenase-like cupin family protein